MLKSDKVRIGSGAPRPRPDPAVHTRTLTTVDAGASLLNVTGAAHRKGLANQVVDLLGDHQWGALRALYVWADIETLTERVVLGTRAPVRDENIAPRLPPNVLLSSAHWRVGG